MPTVASIVRPSDRKDRSAAVLRPATWFDFEQLHLTLDLYRNASVQLLSDSWGFEPRALPLEYTLEVAEF
jgi:hypothetical protein